MSALQIHYDCDPGQDDAVALLYALGSENIDIQSISVVGGNIDVDQCARNALQILEVSQKSNIPVYKGCSKPLERSLIMLPHVFGPTGMAGAEDLPIPSINAMDLNAVDFINDNMRLNTVVATGPLTNLAQAFLNDAKLPRQINNLILMGGCVKPDPVFGWMGNLTVEGTEKGKAEYNFAVDPEATKIVFQSEVESIALIGLDVTRTVLFNGDLQSRLNDIETESAKIASKILSVAGEEDKETYKKLWTYPNEPIRAMHDIIAMAYVDRPDIFETEKLYVRIDVEKIPGQTLIDNINPDHKNVTAITDLDREQFIDILCENIARLP